MMALKSVSDAIDKLEVQEEDTKQAIKDVLTEVQGIQLDVVEGVDGSGTAATQTLTGITTDDTLVSVIGIDGDAAALADSVVDRTSDVSISDADEITVDGSDTSAEMLVVVWFDKE